MSHDIRTPMNVIMGFTNIALQHADDPGKMKECLEKIRVSGSNLQELIDDVLDISRIESGEFKIVSQPVKLPELFDFYCQAIAGMAEAEHIPIPHACFGQSLHFQKLPARDFMDEFIADGVAIRPHRGQLDFFHQLDHDDAGFDVVGQADLLLLIARCVYDDYIHFSHLTPP